MTIITIRENGRKKSTGDDSYFPGIKTETRLNATIASFTAVMSAETRGKHQGYFYSFIDEKQELGLNIFKASEDKLTRSL